MDVQIDKMLKDEHLSVPANIQGKLYLKPQFLEGLLATLYHSLSSFEEVSFAYFFGSAARGEAYRDIDVVLAGTQILSYGAEVFEDSFVVANQYIGTFTGQPTETPPPPPPPPPIFVDDVESGDFSGWDVVIGSPLVSSGDAYNGTYKAVFDDVGDRIRKDVLIRP